MIYDTYTASNSSKGFFSYFDEIVKNDNMDSIYLIKGGPGCGKSTFMKKIAKYFDNDMTIEAIHCSSDPESLDGIVIKEKRLAIIDATPPHSYEMIYPGAHESIIDMSRFWDKTKLISNKDEIMLLTNTISDGYKKVYNLLKPAGQLYEDIYYKSKDCVSNEKVVSYVKRCIKQNAFTPITNESHIHKRMLSSICSNEKNTFIESINKYCDFGIIIEDDALISPIIISKFISYFKKSGYDMILFSNPLCPETIIDHFVVPQLKFGVFSTNKIFNLSYQSENFKLLRTRGFIKQESKSTLREHTIFRKKLILELLGEAKENLKTIKEKHDELEMIYSDAMDYNSLNIYTEEFIKLII